MSTIDALQTICLVILSGSTLFTAVSLGQVVCNRERERSKARGPRP